MLYLKHFLKIASYGGGGKGPIWLTYYIHVVLFMVYYQSVGVIKKVCNLNTQRRAYRFVYCPTQGTCLMLIIFHHGDNYLTGFDDYPGFFPSVLKSRIQGTNCLNFSPPRAESWSEPLWPHFFVARLSENLSHFQHLFQNNWAMAQSNLRQKEFKVVKIKDHALFQGEEV